MSKTSITEIVETLNTDRNRQTWPEIMFTASSGYFRTSRRISRDLLKPAGRPVLLLLMSIWSLSITSGGHMMLTSLLT
jgi:hypothetical protein